MYIKYICPQCKGTGRLVTELPEHQDIDCPNCDDGYIRREIEAPELTTLQADMDIIKPQIQALYDDLNP